MYIDVTGFSNEGRGCSKKKTKTKNKAPGVSKTRGRSGVRGLSFFFLKNAVLGVG